MGKRLTVLGSTGSIGTQTLDVAGRLGLEVTAITANRNVELAESQARAFAPKVAAMADERAARELRVRLADTPVRVLAGEQGVIEAARLETDIVESSLVGVAGLRPTMAAIEEGNRRIALANKETLVCSGHLFTSAISRFGCELLPVDSEHSAIFQCLMGGSRGEVKRILLTASGGPFLNLSREEMARVTPERALRHPNWSMGAKVTIDSASMMNKGLEVIEAMHLFSMPPERIHVLVHPQSIVHSAVEYVDGSVIAQMGVPDMRLPIQLALTYPERTVSPVAPLDLVGVGSLTFSEPDLEKFPCLALALKVAGRRDAAPVVMNAANEVAVGLFLSGRIAFTEIPELVVSAVEELGALSADSVDEVMERDRQARDFILKDR